MRFTGDKSKVLIQEDEIRKIKWVEFSELKGHLIFKGQYEMTMDAVNEVMPEISKQAT